MLLKEKSPEYNSDQPEQVLTDINYQYIEQMVDKLKLQKNFCLPAGFKLHCEIFEALMQQI
jgi:hypothetical protein